MASWLYAEARGLVKQNVARIARPLSPERSAQTNAVDLPRRSSVGRMIIVPAAGPVSENWAERSGGRSLNSRITASRHSAPDSPPKSVRPCSQSSLTATVQASPSRRVLSISSENLVMVPHSCFGGLARLGRATRPLRAGHLNPSVQVAGSLHADRADREVRVGSISEVGQRKRHVRFPPVSDKTADIAGGPFRANTGSRGPIQSPYRREAESPREW